MHTVLRPFLLVLCIVIVFAGIVLAVLAHPSFGTYRHVTKERLVQSPNWRDGMFQNQEPTPQFTGDVSAGNTLWRFLTSGDTVRVPDKPVHAVKTNLRALPLQTDWLVWFGHSSYLFCLGGKRVLVDPVLKPEWPSSWMLRAFRGTDIYRPDDMPDIDILVITHEHWDHMDYATLRDICQKVKHVVCPLGIADYLRYWHYPEEMIIEMDWYEQSSVTNDNLQITCLPARHFSNRLLAKRNQTLWASFMVEYNGKKVYIGGDGGYDKRFREIHDRFGTVDLAFLENGQYNANWRYIHTMPEDLEKAILDLQAEQVFTVHHDKFALAMHPWQEPDSTARHIVDKYGIKLLDAPIGYVQQY